MYNKNSNLSDIVTYSRRFTFTLRTILYLTKQNLSQYAIMNAGNFCTIFVITITELYRPKNHNNCLSKYLKNECFDCRLPNPYYVHSCSNNLIELLLSLNFRHTKFPNENISNVVENKSNSKLMSMRNLHKNKTHFILTLCFINTELNKIENRNLIFK